MVILLNLFCSAVDIALPLFQRYAIDNFIETGSTKGLPVFALVYLVVIGLQTISVIAFTPRGNVRIEMDGKRYEKSLFCASSDLIISLL